MTIHGAGALIRPTLGGVAVVCCVHDREKRQIVTEAQCIELAREFGIAYDPKQDFFFTCACCGNLFADREDVPKFCHACRGGLVHQLAAPLPEPTGRM